MKRLLGLLLFPMLAWGQVTPTIPNNTVLGNTSGGIAAPSALTALPASMGNTNTVYVTNAPYNAKCDGFTDDTAAFQAAINHFTVGYGEVLIPATNNINCIIKGNLTIAQDGIHIAGAGPGSTVIQFSPTANGALFTSSKGASILNDFTLSDLTIYTGDTTYTKTAILLMDNTNPRILNVDIQGGADGFTGGSATTNPCSAISDTQAGSIGIRTCGRAGLTVVNVQETVDRCLVISQNPNDANNESFDHADFRNWGCTNVAGVAAPVIGADPGITMTNDTFNQIAWVGYTYGLYMNDATTGTISSHDVTFQNVRWEQGTLSTGYNFYIVDSGTGSNQFQMLNLYDIYNGTTGNGIYCRACIGLNVIGYFSSATTTAFNLDASDFDVQWSNVHPNSTATNTLAGQALTKGYYTWKNYNIPSDALYNNANESESAYIGAALSVGGQNGGQPYGYYSSSWGTTGYLFSEAATTVHDTTSSGTIAEEAINAFGAQTLTAASATTVTNLTGVYFAPPVASTNVTATNVYAAHVAGNLLVDGTTTATGGVVGAPVLLARSGIQSGVVPSSYMDSTGHLVIGQNPGNSATVTFSVCALTPGSTGCTVTCSAVCFAGTSAGDVGRVVTVYSGSAYFICTITAYSSTTVATCTAAATNGGNLSSSAYTNANSWISGTAATTNTAYSGGVVLSTPFYQAYPNIYLFMPGNSPIGQQGNAATVTGVAISGVGGQFTCTCSGLAVGMSLTISGTYGGTGSITGYTNPTTYYVTATNGTSTFTLDSQPFAAIVTTTGTPTGLTYTPGVGAEIV